MLAVAVKSAGTDPVMVVVPLLGMIVMEVTLARTTLTVVVPLTAAEAAVIVLGVELTATGVSNPLALIVASVVGLIDQLRPLTLVLELPSS
jgi:hypothetical protein